MAGWIGTHLKKGSSEGADNSMGLRQALTNTQVMKRPKAASGSGKSGPPLGGPASAALPNLKRC